MTHYNDKIPQACEHRKQTAHDRMLTIDSYYEIQMIGWEKEKGLTHYHLFTNANLDSAFTATLMRINSRKAIVDWKSNEEKPQDSYREQDIPKYKALWEACKGVRFEVKILPTWGDADILEAARNLYDEYVSRQISDIFHNGK